MGNRYNNHHIHHQNLQQRSTFLPMLCSRTSIKDVHRRRPPNPSSSTHPVSASSQKVTFMGQINRSNRVTGYPTTAAAATTPVKYHKLLRLFSGKNPSSATTTTITTSRSGSGEKIVRRSLSERQMSFRDHRSEKIYAAVINVAELDPPLPVVKRLQQPAAAADGNLWKRRYGGRCELKTLQVEDIHLRNKRCGQQICTTV